MTPAKGDRVACRCAPRCCQVWGYPGLPKASPCVDAVVLEIRDTDSEAGPEALIERGPGAFYYVAIGDGMVERRERARRAWVSLSGLVVVTRAVASSEVA